MTAPVAASATNAYRGSPPAAFFTIIAMSTFLAAARVALFAKIAMPAIVAENSRCIFRNNRYGSNFESSHKFFEHPLQHSVTPQSSHKILENSSHSSLVFPQSSQIPLPHLSHHMICLQSSQNVLEHSSQPLACLPSWQELSSHEQHLDAQDSQLRSMHSTQKKNPLPSRLFTATTEKKASCAHF